MRSIPQTPEGPTFGFDMIIDYLGNIDPGQKHQRA